MDRPNLIEFDDGPKADYFMCERCRTHIALRRDFLSFHWFPPHLGAFYGGVFNTAINVREDQAVHDLQINEYTLHQVLQCPIYCWNCDETLGYKYVWLHPLGRQPCVQNEMVMLYIDQLSRRRGDEVQVLSEDGLLCDIIQNDIDNRYIYSFPITTADP